LLLKIKREIIFQQEETEIIKETGERLILFAYFFFAENKKRKFFTAVIGFSNFKRISK